MGFCPRHDDNFLGKENGISAGLGNGCGARVAPFECLKDSPGSFLRLEANDAYTIEGLILVRPLHHTWNVDPLQKRNPLAFQLADFWEFSAQKVGTSVSRDYSRACAGGFPPAKLIIRPAQTFPPASRLQESAMTYEGVSRNQLHSELAFPI